MCKVMWTNRSIVFIISAIILSGYYLSTIGKSPGPPDNKQSQSIQAPNSSSPGPDWAPSQEALDTWRNTAPLVHCPHGSDRRQEILDKLKSLIASNSSSFCTCPTEVTFLLLTNKASQFLPVSEQLYKLCGCNYVHIRLNSTEWPGWQLSYKVSPFLQWLEEHGSSLPPESFVIVADAFDTGIIGDASNIVTGFLEYECEILGMSTVADWPPDKELKIFEEEKYPWSKCRPHLSSGAFMARVSDAIFYLREWENDWRSHGEKKDWDDQTGLRRVHRKYYPRFKVDTLARVWTRCDTKMDCL